MGAGRIYTENPDGSRSNDAYINGSSFYSLQSANLDNTTPFRIDVNGEKPFITVQTQRLSQDGMTEHLNLTVSTDDFFFSVRSFLESHETILLQPDSSPKDIERMKNMADFIRNVLEDMSASGEHLSDWQHKEIEDLGIDFAATLSGNDSRENLLRQKETREKRRAQQIAEYEQNENDSSYNYSNDQEAANTPVQCYVGPDGSEIYTNTSAEEIMESYRLNAISTCKDFRVDEPTNSANSGVSIQKNILQNTP